MKNPGKIFEEDFKGSVSNDNVIIRLKDAGGWSQGNSDKRFTITNICDFIYYNDELYLLELKSTKGKSITLNRLEKDIKRLEKYRGKKGVRGFVINFRDLEETYFMREESLLLFSRLNNISMDKPARSISIQFFRQYCVRIPQTKKRTRYSYDLSVLEIKD